MSVREYIGARYVPLFIGEWNNTVTYEPLSIVFYQGNSYTSRQFVPTGIDIDNDIYWAETGNYNAQIEQYREEVFAVSNALPIDFFNPDNTVKDYIDDSIDVLGSIIPSSEFTNENTVKDYIDATKEDIETLKTGVFTTQIGIDDNSLSAYTVLTIPRDRVSVSYAFRDVTYQQGRIYDFVKNSDATLAINGSLKGVAVNDGSILVNNAFEDSQYWYILAFDESGEPHVYADLTRSRTGMQLVNDGMVSAFGIWSPIIVNGVIFNWNSVLPDVDPNSNKQDLYNRKHTRSIFAWDDDYYHLITIDGRLASSMGMTFAEMASFCARLGFDNCVNMDGGGSSQLWTCGNVAMNFVFPDSGDSNTIFSTRNVPGLMMFTEVQ